MEAIFTSPFDSTLRIKVLDDRTIYLGGTGPTGPLNSQLATLGVTQDDETWHQLVPQ